MLFRSATNTVALELARDSLPGREAFVAELARLPWVAGVTVEDNRLRVAVLDPDAARPGLLPLVVAHNLVLNRYEWVRPSLEEIFLTLSQ